MRLTISPSPLVMRPARRRPASRSRRCHALLSRTRGRRSPRRRPSGRTVRCGWRAARQIGSCSPSRPTSARPSAIGSVTADALNMDWGPDSRPRSPSRRAVQSSSPTRSSRTTLQRAHLLDALDGWRHNFAPPVPITSDSTSQRFQTRRDRSRRPGLLSMARQAQRRRGRLPRASPYPGAALAYAWADGSGMRFSDTRPRSSTIPANAANSASLLPAPAGRQLMFRNVFGGIGARPCRRHLQGSHDTRAAAPREPRQLEDRCLPAPRAEPHDRARRLPITRPGSPAASARQGLFYAHADDRRCAVQRAPRPASPDRQPARPYVLADVECHSSCLEGVRWREGTGPLAGLARRRPELERRRARLPKQPMPRISSADRPAATMSSCPG